jgi:hypothetical protein
LLVSRGNGRARQSAAQGKRQPSGYGSLPLADKQTIVSWNFAPSSTPKAVGLFQFAATPLLYCTWVM